MISRIINRVTPGRRGVSRIDGVIARFDEWTHELMEGKADIAEQMSDNIAQMAELQAEQDFLEAKMVRATKILGSIEALKGEA